MYLRSTASFVAACRKRQPHNQEFWKKYFQQIIYNPHSSDKELLLQAFLFFNIKEYFPKCNELILFEESPDCKGSTQLGKHDCVYLTNQHTIFLIETKFISINTSGETARRKRNKQRNQVLEQVKTLNSKLNILWQIPTEQIHCGIFTTDLDFSNYINNQHVHDSGIKVIAKSVLIQDLESWQMKKSNELSKNNLGDLVGNGSNIVSETSVQGTGKLWKHLFTSCDVCITSDLCKQLGICYFNL